MLSAIAHSRWVDKHITQFIQRVLYRCTLLDLNGYVALLHLSKGYSVLELEVAPGDLICEII